MIFHSLPVSFSQFDSLAAITSRTDHPKNIITESSEVMSILSIVIDDMGQVPQYQICIRHAKTGLNLLKIVDRKVENTRMFIIADGMLFGFMKLLHGTFVTLLA